MKTCKKTGYLVLLIGIAFAVPAANISAAYAQSSSGSSQSSDNGSQKKKPPGGGGY